MTNFDLIAEAIEMMNAGNNEQAIARLKQFTALNTPKVKGGGKVRIYDWTGPNEPQMYCRGVFHDADNSVAVATNCRVMLISKQDYNANLNGKCIDKKGDEVKMRYPDYNRVIPKNGLVERDVNIKRLTEMLSELRAEKKIDKTVDYLAFNVCDKDNPFYVDPKYCKLIVTLPEGKFYFTGPSFPMVYKSDDGNYTALIMPIRVSDKCIGMEKITIEDDK